MRTVSYLYGLARAAELPEFPDLHGVSDAPVRTVVHADVGGYVSTVPASEFGQEALQAHLEDLTWLERTARQHDRVVQVCSRVTTTVPVRLATVFADDRSVLARLDALAHTATELLDQLDGREEWGVKLYAAESAEAPEPADSTVSSGAAYLQRRRAQHSRRAESAAEAARDADQVFATLSGVAVRARRHRPQDPQLTGDPRPMLLNAAFLVDRADADAFRGEVLRVAGKRAPDSVALTGPWPAYSFAALDDP